MRVLVVGLATTGASVVSYTRAAGHDVTVLEDRPVRDGTAGEGYRARAERAVADGAVLVERPDAREAAAHARAADLVVPSPGVRPDHPARRRRARRRRAGAFGDRSRRGAPAGAPRCAAAGRGHRHQRQDDRHHPDRRDGARARGSPAPQPATSVVRSSMPPVTMSRSSWPRSRRSSSRSRPTRSLPTSRCCSTSPRTTSTGTAPSTPTRRPRRGCSPTRGPTPCWSSTATIPWPTRSRPTPPAGSSASRRVRRPAAATACVGADLVGPAGAFAPVPASGAPHDTANALAASGRGGGGRRRHRCGRPYPRRLRRPRPPRAAGGGARRGPVLRRLQGHQPARHRQRARGLRPRGPHRRGPEQGARPGGSARPGLAPSVRGRHRRGGRRDRGRVRGCGAGGARRLDARRGACGVRSTPGPTTRCCCRQRARRSTGTRATPSAATTSPAKSGCSRRLRA